jgi:hypothetical protein
MAPILRNKNSRATEVGLRTAWSQHRHSPAFHSPTHSVKYEANAVRREVNPS